MNRANDASLSSGLRQGNGGQAASVRSESLLECAIALAELGVRTLPISSPSMPVSSWNKSPGKTPMLQAWQKEASTDPALLQHWFGGTRQVNLGMLMGPASGLVAFDIDPRHGGYESWERAERELGSFPLGPRSKTGSGGLHIFALYPEGCGRIQNGTNLCGYTGIDFKADSGQVIGPPSLHTCGERYRWVEGLALGEIEAPHLPDAWLQLILRRDKPKAKTSNSTRATTASGAILEGSRNDTLFRRACAMRAQGAECRTDHPGERQAPRLAR